MTDYARDFEEIVEAGLGHLSSRSQSTWALGDIATKALSRELIATPFSRERDLMEIVAYTIAKLARLWGCSPQSLSEWCLTAIFFPPELRTFAKTGPDGETRPLPFSFYDVARRKCADLETARDALQYACDQRLSYKRFELYLDGSYGVFTVDKKELPEFLTRDIPDHVSRVTVTIQGASGNGKIDG